MHWILVYFYVFDISFVLALILTPIFKRLSFRWGMVDQPNLERKIHTQAMPLLGGVAVFTAFALNVIFNYAIVLPAVAHFNWPFGDAGDLREHIPGAFSVARKLIVLVVGGLLMVLLGVCDDKYELKPGRKLLGQIAIAWLVAANGMRISFFLHSTLASYILTIGWIVTITNAMNFLDNMDGLCTGVGLVCAFMFAFVAGIQGQYFVCLMGFTLAGALLGFLPHNFKPASIFLGDAGSHFIGYALAVFAVMGTFYRAGEKTHLPVLIPLFVMAVPLFDMAMVMWIRFRHGQPVYIGDVNHISHRLVRLGLPQSWAVTLIYLITATMGLGATVLLWVDMTGALVVIVQGICILAIVTLFERAGSKS
jgi:UDP-GlcNAc:undecaprenyl-phosphate GlcNAc-1-phosphate transferase